MLDAASLIAYIGPGAGITFLGSFFVLLTAFALLALSLITWPFRAVRQWLVRRKLKPVDGCERGIVIGLDGLDAARTRRLMAEGRLPHLSRLAEQGTFTELGTTLPPISPVAWSSFQTGVNPGKHGIFDFLNRDLRTCLPELSSVRIDERPAGWLSWLGIGGASLRMLRRSQPFWKILGEHGVFSTILRVPITFPPEKFFGLSLSAMCAPDLRGTQGSFTLFSTDPAECGDTTGGRRILIARRGDRIDIDLPGPPNRPGATPAEFTAPLRLRVLPGGDAVELTVGNVKLKLGVGHDSRWVRVDFRRGWFASASGICRFRLESVAPHLRLYVTPIHLDPERPAMPLSHPLYYSIYLAKLHDSFATLGLAEDTWGLNSGAIDEATFLAHAWDIHDERERMLFDALRRMPRGLTVCVFDGSDRIQHMFHRHDNPDHPANVGRDTTRHAGVIDAMYERMDDLVGRVAKEVRGDDVLLVLSDHGFCDFSRGVNLNVWLREQGYLTMLEGAAPGDYLAGVDWSKTRAYSFGLSGVYLNLAGREARGIVPANAAAELRTEIATKLATLHDTERNRRAIRAVYDAKTSYRGPYSTDGPDLVVGYERGYRASWDNAVGRTDGPMIHDNTRYWSGDHCVDPSLVPGVLFANRRLDQTGAPSIIDLAPTILRLFGVAPPAYMDGRPLSLSRAAAEAVAPAAPSEVAASEAADAMSQS